MGRTRGAIASGHELTSKAAAEILIQGGNAFDAAIAGCFASCVVECTLTSLGGSGFMTAYSGHDDKDYFFDFFVDVPGLGLDKSIEPNFFPVLVDFGTVTQEFHIGYGSIAVPGNVRGLFQAHDKLGNMPIKDVMAPAIRYAKEGFTIDKMQERILKILEPIFTHYDEGKAAFLKDGDMLKEGDILKFTELSDTMAHLAENGADDFYTGDIAKAMLSALDGRGALLTARDLREYKSIEREPLEVNYRGHTIITNPPPSSGGCLICYALKLIERFDFKKYPYAKRDYVDLMASVMAATNNARGRHFDAKLFEDGIAEEFLSETKMKKGYDEVIKILSCFEECKFDDKAHNNLGSTTHISVVDENDNAASITTSNGEGCGYIVPGVGLMLNNMMGEEDLNPHGFHTHDAGIRLSSMMAPTIVKRNGIPEIILGSGGSNRLRTAIMQCIVKILDYKMPIDEAANSGRIHYELGRLDLEPGYEVSEVMQLKKKFDITLWERKNMFFGGVHAVSKINGRMDGSGDSRRGGHFIEVK
jgi:gamma-glutamyltranspeptidase/glutathione hydrolase